MHGGGGLWVCWVCSSTRRWMWSVAALMEAALDVSEPAVWATVRMMLPRLFCICRMARASEPIVGGMDVEFGAGEVAGSNRGGAIGDKTDCAGNSPGKDERDDSADKRTQKGGCPEGEEDCAIGCLQAIHIGVALILLDWTRSLMDSNSAASMERI